MMVASGSSRAKRPACARRCGAPPAGRTPNCGLSSLSAALHPAQFLPLPPDQCLRTPRLHMAAVPSDEFADFQVAATPFANHGGVSGTRQPLPLDLFCEAGEEQVTEADGGEWGDFAAAAGGAGSSWQVQQHHQQQQQQPAPTNSAAFAKGEDVWYSDRSGGWVAAQVGGGSAGPWPAQCGCPSLQC
jgi:hypothetical protein